ncbi:MAG: sensor domain-containing diguanylate cyclase [Planctomycetota bacterium]|nr:MAG: sensor domain-containing diguanylate cyclase [Planctomycetota bacterium]
MLDFLGGLFDTSGFMARWNCGEWSAAHGWTHVAADLLTWSAYTAIPIVLLFYVRKRRDVQFHSVFLLFGAFIFSCGTVHLVESTLFWQPWYRLSALTKVATAILSWGTVFALIRLTPGALRLPSMAQLSALVEASGDAVVGMDLNGRISVWNSGAVALHGRDSDAMIGSDVRALVPPEHRAEYADALARVREGQAVPPFDTQRLRADGSRFDVSLRLSPVRDRHGAVVGCAMIERDATSRKEAERKLQRLARELEEEAQQDPLTGLPNRRAIEAALARETSRARRSGSHLLAVLLDLDDFKHINDTLGHAVGDVVLRNAARRMAACLRTEDVLARIGGDEFVALLPETRLAEGRCVAERLRLSVREQPVEASGHELRLSASFGLTELPHDVASIEEVLTLTRGALAHSKARGKNRLAWVAGGGRLCDDAGGPPHAIDARELARSLRVLAQPLVDLRRREIVGQELLVRGPAGPYERPDDLFRYSIENNALTAVDLCCMRACVAASRRLPVRGRVHLNAFPSTLLVTPTERLVELLAAGGSPSRYCIEISEQQFLGDPAALRSRLAGLRASGIAFAIDDVGFGKSSLEALIVLEPEIVKIDRSFVHGIARDAQLAARLERLLRTVQALDSEIVAEGLEDPADQDVLLRLGVRVAQGYALGRPTEIADEALTGDGELRA